MKPQGMNYGRGISECLIDDASKRFQADSGRQTANSIIKNGIDNTSENHDAVVKMSRMFSDEVEAMEITNQKKSGRCWIFAGMNVLRYLIHKNLKIENADFELSQSYIMFWDKLEKANYFLESVIETAGQEKDSRLVMWIFQNILNDGGQWDMLVSVIEKYGVVPKLAMPESFHSSNSSKMNAVLCRKLRRDGIILRNMHADGGNEERLRAEKEKMISEFYGLMCLFLGEPPRTFNFEYRDKDHVFHRDADITPKEFFNKYVGERYLDDYVSVINAPTKDKPFGKTYTVRYLGNVIGGKRVTYLNLESSELEKFAGKQIKDGEPVWFGSDVGKYSDRDAGIMDTALYPYENVLGTSLEINKADMLDYGETCLTHAMMLVGVNVTEDGLIDKWKVENSWGKDVGEKGFFVMSSEWFKNYVCQVVVNRKYLSDEQKKALLEEPIALEPWDPIGSLAD